MKLVLLLFVAVVRLYAVDCLTGQGPLQLGQERCPVFSDGWMNVKIGGSHMYTADYGIFTPDQAYCQTATGTAHTIEDCDRLIANLSAVTTSLSCLALGYRVTCHNDHEIVIALNGSQCRIDKNNNAVIVGDPERCWDAIVMAHMIMGAQISRYSQSGKLLYEALERVALVLHKELSSDMKGIQ